MQLENNDLKNRTRIIHYVIVLIISVIGLVRFKADFSKDSRTMFQSFFIDAIAPIQEGMVSGQGWIEGIASNYFYLVGLKKENIGLLKKLDELSQDVFSLKNVQDENKRLRALLEFGETIPVKKTSAQVIGWDASNEFNTIRINKGSNDGVSKNSPVVNSKGLIGIISSTSSNYSDVQTLLDFNYKVDVLVGENRTHAILEGSGRSNGKLKYVTNASTINVDDILKTSGFSPFYPKGIRVGKVTSVERNEYELTQKVLVEYFVDFSQIEEVVILSKRVEP